MTLPKSFTTVTTSSKILAFILFITLPFIGFYLGMQYAKSEVIDKDYVGFFSLCNHIEYSCDEGYEGFNDFWGCGCQKTIEYASITSNPIPTPDDPVSQVPNDWKTYTNEEYGFEFMYPRDWFLYSEGITASSEIDYYVNIVSTDPEDGGNFAGFSLSIYKNVQKFSDEAFLSRLKNYYLPYIGHGDIDQHLKDSTTLKIEGKNGYLFKSDTATENIHPYYYFFYNDELLFRIDSSEDIGFPERKEREINNKILSTFRFLDKGSGAEKTCLDGSECRWDGDLYAECITYDGSVPGICSTYGIAGCFHVVENGKVTDKEMCFDPF